MAQRWLILVCLYLSVFPSLFAEMAAVRERAELKCVEKAVPSRFLRVVLYYT